jgi:cation diffusion facilitator CzcD-associated flavoprotein CzcO
MSTTEAKRTDNGEIEDLDVIVVGAGFAGLYLLDRLRSMGMAVQVFEAGGGLGGVWYWNCYPGARVDSPGPIYQYSRDDLWRSWQFSELYPSWQDIDHHLRPTRKSQSVTMPTQNRQWILNARPPDRLTGEEFRWKVAPIPRPAEGQVLVRNLIVALGQPKGPNQSAPLVSTTSVVAGARNHRNRLALPRPHAGPPLPERGEPVWADSQFVEGSYDATRST